MLWHIRLDHVSEKGQYELVKQCVLGSEHLGNLMFYDHCVALPHTHLTMLNLICEDQLLSHP